MDEEQRLSFLAAVRKNVQRRLQWYCQACQKQSRDQIGFKDHCGTESHRRRMESLGLDPDLPIPEAPRDLGENAFQRRLRERLLHGIPSHSEEIVEFCLYLMRFRSSEVAFFFLEVFAHPTVIRAFDAQDGLLTTLEVCRLIAEDDFSPEDAEAFGESIPFISYMVMEYFKSHIVLLAKSVPATENISAPPNLDTSDETMCVLFEQLRMDPSVCRGWGPVRTFLRCDGHHTMLKILETML